MHVKIFVLPNITTALCWNHCLHGRLNLVCVQFAKARILMEGALQGQKAQESKQRYQVSSYDVLFQSAAHTHFTQATTREVGWAFPFSATIAFLNSSPYNGCTDAPNQTMLSNIPFMKLTLVPRRVQIKVQLKVHLQSFQYSTCQLCRCSVDVVLFLLLFLELDFHVEHNSLLRQ